MKKLLMIYKKLIQKSNLNINRSIKNNKITTNKVIIYK